MPEILTGDGLAVARVWLDRAGEVAKGSGCLKRQCGCVMVSADGVEIAAAFNSLPGPDGAVCPHCGDGYKAIRPGFKSDKTCCMHAEQRAVALAFRNFGDKVDGCTMYFHSLDEVTGAPRPSGRPYCTHCSKMALDAGVKYWVLEHDDGVTRYDAAEYNRISFEYGDA